MLNQLRGAPQLALMALVPVLVLLTIRHVEGSLSGRAFVAAMTAAFTAQILTSTEVFATAVLFGGLTLLAAYLLYAERREALRRTAVLAGAALAGTAVLASPLLYNVFFRDRTLPEQALADFPADLLSFAVPGPLVAAAPERVGAIQPSWATGAAYLGPPLLALLAAFAVRYRRDRRALLVLVAFAVPAIAALGTYLHVGGTDTGIPMPWLAFDGLPLLRYAIPLRFPAFAFLAAGVAAAMWLARRPTRARWALALVAVACLLPAVGNDDWHTRLDDVPFFADGGYEGRLSAEDNVLTVPTWGRNMYWQVQGDFSFRLAAGYVGAFPESYMRYGAWRDLLRVPLGEEGVPSLAELRRFVAAKGVTAIVVERDHPVAGRRVFRSLAGPPVEAGGVLLYRLRAARLRTVAKKTRGAGAGMFSAMHQPWMSVVVPAYNEEQAIADMVRAIRERLEQLARPYEIVVVDNASEDAHRRARRAACGRRAGPAAAQRREPRQGLLGPARDARGRRAAAPAVRRRLRALARLAAADARRDRGRRRGRRLAPRGRRRGRPHAAAAAAARRLALHRADATPARRAYARRVLRLQALAWRGGAGRLLAPASSTAGRSTPSRWRWRVAWATACARSGSSGSTARSPSCRSCAPSGPPSGTCWSPAATCAFRPRAQGPVAAEAVADSPESRA